MVEPVIEVRNLWKTYRTSGGDVDALRGISFTLAPGTVVVVVGPSGSGKTSLLNLISGLDQPTDGDVRVGGQLLSTLQGDDGTDFRRRSIGFVFQFFNLIPTMSAADNVAIPLLAEGLSRSEIDRRAAAALASVKLAERAGRRAADLSGGEMQRVAIARALVMNPLVVLADEPTGNLDSVTGETILQLLCSASRAGGRTVLLVTHSYQAAAYADRTLVMQDGQIVEDVSADEPDLRVVPSTRKRRAEEAGGPRRVR
jgi:putative ABC transport system ATP-binding protein